MDIKREPLNRLPLENGWIVDWGLLHSLKESNRWGDICEEQIEDVILDLVSLGYCSLEDIKEKA